jgi:hypothetical protein
MSLYSVVQGETDLVLTSNLDSSATEVYFKSGITGTATLTGSVTQSSESLTGSNSYSFDGNDQVRYTASSGFGSTDDIGLEVVFKKTGSVASGGETIVRRRGGSIYGDGARITLNADGTIQGIVNTYTGGTSRSSQVTTSGTYNDGKFHHVVLLWRDNHYFRLYIDGTLAGTASGSIGNIGSGDALILGATQSQGGSQAYSEYFNGLIDFVALYNAAPSNSGGADTFVANHLAEFADRVISVDEMNATNGIFVQPTVVITRAVNYSADPATASSLFVDPAVSNFDVQTSLENYMANTAAPEQWYKFDTFPFVNYGSGGAAVFSDFGTLTRKVGEGPDRGSSLELPGTLANGYFFTSSPAVFSTEVSDGNFTTGAWFKFESGLSNTSKSIVQFQVSSTEKIYIKAVDKKIRFGLITSSATYEHTTTADTYNDNAWHFAAIRWNGTDLCFHLDNVEVYNTTTSGTITGLNNIVFNGGGGGSETYKWQLAHPFIGTYSGIDETKLSAIWNAGTRTLQGGAGFVEPRITNNNAYNDYVETLNPVLDLRFDGTGAPVNYSTSTAVSYTIEVSGTNYSTGVSTRNTRGYNFTNKNTGITGSFNHSTSGFSDNTKSVSIYAKMASVTGSTDIHTYYTDQQFNTTPGISINATSSGPAFSVFPTLTQSNWRGIAAGTGYYDGNYHLFTAVRNGTGMTFYVDGKSVGTATLGSYTQANVGGYAIGGLETTYFAASAATVDKNIDEVQVFDYALTDAQVFEMWQKIGVDTANATNATFPTPVGIAGAGATISAEPLSASALLLDPTQQDTVAPTIDPMTAFITTVMPNFAATSTATITADPATASGLLPDPQYNIGDGHSADHMNASAAMGDHRALIPGFWNASPMIANPAEMVQPGLATTQGGLVLAEVMRSSAALVLPPAYKTLFDDKWYETLYSQHSQKHNFRNANGGGNGEAILKLFDDVTSSISLSTPLANRKVTNNLTTTITTDGIVVDETSPTMNVVGDFNPSSNTPIISAGYFDDYERKAVRFNNITTGYEGSDYTNTSFTLELSIKTTKANQIIAYGRTRSFFYYQATATTFGLSDGKLFLKATNAIGPAPLSHYKETTPGTSIIGNKRIDDGQWHHIVIQYGWDDERIQFWIDGDLDIQRIRVITLDGPSFLGFNSQASTYASDFQTSAWSYDSHGFLRDNEVDDHRYKYIKYEPVKAEPMIASATSGDHLGGGNRARALMLYWWPTDTMQGAPFPAIYDTANFNPDGGTGFPTFDESLSTADFIKAGPQEYYGWDIFPVDITGLYVSDLVKPEAYGGSQNIKVGAKSAFRTGENYPLDNQYLYNSQGSFRDPVTDARRYIDVVNDIDLRNFDAIFFRNFPDEAVERDEFTTNQVVDSYFGSKEAGLYEEFLKSLRAAVDTGVSLYVTNYQLALDLGIVDRVETVPDMNDLVGFDSDPYSPTIVPTDASELLTTFGAKWYDSYKNNKLRVVNELEGFTTEPSFIYTDYAYYESSDENRFGAPNRPFARYIYRPDGLRVGDEFIIANDKRGVSKNFYATPFANVKAGTIITAFANNIRRGVDLITNPYRNYATSIVVKPGDVLKGTQCGGKIIVNFTENLNGAADWGDVDLITDYWINVAYNDGYINEAAKNTLLAASYNLDRKLANGSLTQQEYNKQAFWSSNGMNVISTGTVIDDPTASTPKSGLGKGVRSGIVQKTRKSGAAYAANVSTSTQWFSFAYSYLYPRMGIKVPNILTRGFWWLSNRESYDGIVERPLGATASAVFVDPVATGQKDRTVNATSMIASATVVQASGTSAAAINIAPLPMQATALMNNYVRRYVAEPMTASAVLRTNSTVFTTAVDEVVVYVYHTDPILYLREDVIK